MALNWISSRTGSALPLIGYRAGARQLERQTRRGVGVGGSHRDVPWSWSPCSASRSSP